MYRDRGQVGSSLSEMVYLFVSSHRRQGLKVQAVSELLRLKQHLDHSARLKEPKCKAGWQSPHSMVLPVRTPPCGLISVLSYDACGLMCTAQATAQTVARVRDQQRNCKGSKVDFFNFPPGPHKQSGS